VPPAFWRQQYPKAILAALMEIEPRAAEYWDYNARFSYAVLVPKEAGTTPAPPARMLLQQPPGNQQHPGRQQHPGSQQNQEPAQLKQQRQETVVSADDVIVEPIRVSSQGNVDYAPINCSVPCLWSSLSTGAASFVRTLVIHGHGGRKFTMLHSMEGPEHYPVLAKGVDKQGRHVYMSSTSLTSDVPLTYYTMSHADAIRAPAVRHETAIPGASFVARNCKQDSTCFLRVASTFLPAVTCPSMRFATAVAFFFWILL